MIENPRVEPFLPDEYLHRYPRRADDTETRTAAGGAVVIVQLERGLTFTLNETAALFWQLFDGNTSLAAAVDAVCEQFDADREEASRDAVDMVRDLEARGFLTMLDEPFDQRVE